MGNCLITKLKGTVNNDSLPRFDEIKMVLYIPSRIVCGSFINMSGDFYIRVNPTESVYISFSYDTTPSETKLTSNSGEKDIYIYNDTDSPKKVSFFIGNKTKYKYFLPSNSGYRSGVRVCTDGFKNETSNSLPLVTYLKGASGNWNESEIYGSAEDLAGFKDVITTLSPILLNGNTENVSNYKFTVLNDLDLRQGVTGDIKVLGVCVALESFAVRRSNCSGTIESFVQGLRANGRTTGSIVMSTLVNESNVTFNGNTSNVKGTLTWTENTITQNNITVDA